MDQQKSLFQAFSQADEDIASNYGGTGLGLHLSKQLALLLGGDIKVDSRFGEGSTFVVSVPTGLLEVPWIEELPSYENTIQSSDLSGLDGDDFVESGFTPLAQVGVKTCSEDKDLYNALAEYNSFNVLIADDDKNSREIMASFLKPFPVNIVFADNGEEALLRYREGRLQAIIVDYKMPGLSGLEVMKSIRKSEGTVNTIPILCITGSVKYDEVELIHQAGASYYLSKPISLTSFISEFHKLVLESSASKGVASRIDLDAMNKRYGGVEAITNKTIENFVTQFKDARDYIEREVMGSDVNYGELDNYLHTLGNHAAMLGDQQLTEIARELEHYAQSGELIKLRESLSVTFFYARLDELLNEANSHLEHLSIIKM